MTVDDRGRVWIAEAGAHALAAFPRGVKATPSMQPAITISGPDLEMPHSITFAPDGAWVPCYNDTVLRYGPDQIAASTSAPPELILS